MDRGSLRDTNSTGWSISSGSKVAIGRENQIKRLLGIKKITLIVPVNHTWRDVRDGWYDRHQFQPDNAWIAKDIRPQTAMAPDFRSH